MPGSVIILRDPSKTSTGYMVVTAVVGIVLGLLMLLYPGGTMTLMKTGFRIFQIILSIFVLYFTGNEAVHFFRGGFYGRGGLYVLLGILFIALIWILDVSLIYYAIALFLALIGTTEIVAAFRFPVGKFFLGLLGFIDLMVAVFIILYPVVLALLIAWYVLFWGISRLLLALELRRALN